ncbi:MAG: hypothetical protein QM780_15805 [Hyphomicrobium sp.]|uniref:hypothetical protein n=1 Tax=Hyphomicrobium sp. TaxID=82 RepID=UPI0039E62098
MNELPNEPGWLTTMQMGNRYNVSIQTLHQWTRYAGWSASARKRSGQHVLWSIEAVDEFLRNRPVSKRGARPRWLEVVQHPEA